MMIDEARYWAQGLRALGLDDLIDAYPDPASREDAKQAVYDRINTVIGAATAEDVTARLTAHDCIYALFATPVEVLDDPAVRENGYLMEHPRDDVRIAAAPVQFDDEQLSIRRPGPALGEHTREVLAELGYTAAEVDALLADKVVAAT
jgi:crotonobetainyl-CoA:carnitine CoA-transferase CaiB-like acyl-CoA transferase